MAMLARPSRSDTTLGSTRGPAAGALPALRVSGRAFLTVAVYNPLVRLTGGDSVTIRAALRVVGPAKLSWLGQPGARCRFVGHGQGRK